MSNNPFQTELILEKTKLFWQYPVITEQEFYNQNKDDPLFLGFPWATCIDKQINTNILLKLLLPFLKHKNYYTCCQHILFRKYILLFKILGIQTVYAPHKIKNEDEIKGISIMPCPLYAVNYEDKDRNAEFQNINFSEIPRELLFSFMGGYQNIYLTDASITENIAFGVPKEKIDLIAVKEAAKKAQIHDFIESRDFGYNEIVGERGIKLSGGQRQRIGIARALYKKVDLLILDEATSALDNETENSLMKVVDNLDKNLTIIMVAHRQSSLKNCNYFLDLNNLNENAKST